MAGGSLRKLSLQLGQNKVSGMAASVGLPWPPPPPLHVRDLFKIMTAPALVLSGGGATGSFQVGAVRFLYNNRFHPAIIAATSVGAVNGLKLAEGEGDGSDPNRGLQGLERLWLGMNADTDMYVLDSWVTDSPQWIQDAINKHFGALSIPELIPVLLSSLVPAVLIDAVVRANELSDFVSAAESATGIYNLGPIENLARMQIKPQLFGGDGAIRLRMTTVGLNSGALKYVTEKGWLVDDPKSEVGEFLVDPIQGMIASASIPAWFEIQKMGTEWFVDGGIRQEVPISAAIDMGASQVFAVVSPIPLEKTSNIKGLVDIALRAATDITIAAITANDLEPYGGWGVPVHVIRATVEVEGSRTIDPGLIRINIAYGWMRAFDVLSAFHPGAPDVTLNSDMIASLRKDIWDAENGLRNDATYVNFDPQTNSPHPGYIAKITSDVAAIRQKKTLLSQYLVSRANIAGPSSMPPDITNWRISWEAHQWDPNNNLIDSRAGQIVFPSTPWGAFRFIVEGHIIVDIPAEFPPWAP
jgi:hypothetical protein